MEGAGQEPVLSKELLLSFTLLLSGPLSAAEGASGTGSGLFGESKLAGGEGKLLSTLSLPHLCVCPYACGRPHSTQLYQHVPETRWPIVYSPRYNITFMGLEKLHPFDAGKWGKVISFLKGMEGPTWDAPSPSSNPSAPPTPSLLSFPKTSFSLSHLQSQPSDCLPPLLSKESFQ